MTIKQLLEKNLPSIIEKGYHQACYYFKIISTRKPLFKGFFSPEIYKKILANKEILTNLKIDIWRGHDFPHAEITKYLKDYYLNNYD